QPLDGGAQVVDPQAEVVEARHVDFRRSRGIDRLHQIDLDAGQRQDVLVDVFLLAAKRPSLREAEKVVPEAAQRRLARTADRDLLDAEHAKRPRGRHQREAPDNARTSASVRRPGRFALTRLAMFPDGCWLSRINW